MTKEQLLTCSELTLKTTNTIKYECKNIKNTYENLVSDIQSSFTRNNIVTLDDHHVPILVRPFRNGENIHVDLTCPNNLYPKFKLIIPSPERTAAVKMNAFLIKQMIHINAKESDSFICSNRYLLLNAEFVFYHPSNGNTWKFKFFVFQPKSRKVLRRPSTISHERRQCYTIKQIFPVYFRNYLENNFEKGTFDSRNEFKGKNRVVRHEKFFKDEEEIRILDFIPNEGYQRSYLDYRFYYGGDWGYLKNFLTFRVRLPKKEDNEGFELPNNEIVMFNDFLKILSVKSPIYKSVFEMIHICDKKGQHGAVLIIKVTEGKQGLRNFENNIFTYVLVIKDITERFLKFELVAIRREKAPEGSFNLRKNQTKISECWYTLNFRYLKPDLLLINLNRNDDGFFLGRLIEDRGFLDLKCLGHIPKKYSPYRYGFMSYDEKRGLLYYLHHIEKGILYYFRLVVIDINKIVNGQEG